TPDPSPKDRGGENEAWGGVREEPGIEIPVWEALRADRPADGTVGCSPLPQRGRGAGGEGGLTQRAAARNAEGEVLFHQGDRQGAFLAFSEAVRLDPMFAQAYNNLGAWWYTEGSVEKAGDC